MGGKGIKYDLKKIKEEENIFYFAESSSLSDFNIRLSSYDSWNTGIDSETISSIMHNGTFSTTSPNHFQT